MTEETPIEPVLDAEFDTMIAAAAQKAREELAQRKIDELARVKRELAQILGKMEVGIGDDGRIHFNTELIDIHPICDELKSRGYEWSRRRSTEKQPNMGPNASVYVYKAGPPSETPDPPAAVVASSGCVVQ